LVAVNQINWRRAVANWACHERTDTEFV
jgi:hypothetical protein